MIQLESKVKSLQEKQTNSQNSEANQLRDEVQVLKMKKEQLEGDLSEAVDMIEMTPIMQKKVNEIKVLIDQIDKDATSENEEETERNLSMVRPTTAVKSGLVSMNQSHIRGIAE